MSENPVRFHSLEEIQRVFNSCNSLLHYPRDFKEFPVEYLELIGSNFASGACALHVHPGMSCTGYWSSKYKMQFMTSFKLSFFFIVVPALVQQFRQHLKDPEVRKSTLIKYIRSTIYLTIYPALPAQLNCLLTRMGFIFNKQMILASFGLGGLISYLFETPSRHI